MSQGCFSGFVSLGLLVQMSQGVYLGFGECNYDELCLFGVNDMT